MMIVRNVHILSGACPPSRLVWSGRWRGAAHDKWLMDLMRLFDIRPAPERTYWRQFARGPKALRDAVYALWRTRVDVPVHTSFNEVENAAGWAAVDEAARRLIALAPAQLVEHFLSLN